MSATATRGTRGDRAVKGGWAAAVRRGARHRTVDPAARERAAIASTREAAMAFASLADQLAAIAACDSRVRSRQLAMAASATAAEATEALRHADLALELMGAWELPLARALRTMAGRYEDRTGGSAPVRVLGEARLLAPATESALVQVAHEALLNAVRRGRASVVSLTLAYGDTGVSLTARDDGAGLAHREPFSAGPGRMGLVGLRRLLGHIGGTLELRDAEPRGLVVEGCLPAPPGRRPAKPSRPRREGTS